MDELSESEYEAWLDDVKYLVHVLKESFESDDARYLLDEENDILYVELEGLQDYTEDEIIEIAEPIFDTLELDFEDIILIPLNS
jgi:hypothetical protein